jgi:protein-disulfide isomerase
MHDLLFRSQRALGLADLRRYAEEIGIDPGAVERAVRERGFAERIERDVDSGEESNVEGTPSLFINGFAYDDEITVEGVSAVIDRALASVASGARG